MADPDEQRAIDLPELGEAAVTSLKACAATIMHIPLTPALLENGWTKDEISFSGEGSGCFGGLASYFPDVTPHRFSINQGPAGLTSEPTNHALSGQFNDDVVGFTGADRKLVPSSPVK